MGFFAIIFVLWLAFGVIIGLSTDFFITNSLLVISMAGILSLAGSFGASFLVYLLGLYLQAFQKLFANANPEKFSWGRFIKAFFKYPVVAFSTFLIPGYRHDSIRLEVLARVCEDCFWVGRYRKAVLRVKNEYSTYEQHHCPVCDSHHLENL